MFSGVECRGVRRGAKVSVCGCTQPALPVRTAVAVGGGGRACRVFKSPLHTHILHLPHLGGPQHQHVIVVGHRQVVHQAHARASQLVRHAADSPARLVEFEKRDGHAARPRVRRKRHHTLSAATAAADAAAAAAAGAGAGGRRADSCRVAAAASAAAAAAGCIDDAIVRSELAAGDLAGECGLANRLQSVEVQLVRQARLVQRVQLAAERQHASVGNILQRRASGPCGLPMGCRGVGVG
eukprot:149337-Chlamydomonas_euryale.AAC.1